jgi:hypothetical protein
MISAKEANEREPGGLIAERVRRLSCRGTCDRFTNQESARDMDLISEGKSIHPPRASRIRVIA